MNLENSFGGEKAGIKVLDRTALILDIFAQHAKTKEGKLQVRVVWCELFACFIRRRDVDGPFFCHLTEYHTHNKKGGAGPDDVPPTAAHPPLDAPRAPVHRWVLRSSPLHHITARTIH